MGVGHVIGSLSNSASFKILGLYHMVWITKFLVVQHVEVERLFFI